MTITELLTFINEEHVAGRLDLNTQITTPCIAAGGTEPATIDPEGIGLCFVCEDCASHDPTKR